MRGSPPPERCRFAITTLFRFLTTFWSVYLPFPFTCGPRTFHTRLLLGSTCLLRCCLLLYYLGFCLPYQRLVITRRITALPLPCHPTPPRICRKHYAHVPRRVTFLPLRLGQLPVGVAGFLCHPAVLVRTRTPPPPYCRLPDYLPPAGLGRTANLYQRYLYSPRFFC